MTPSRTATSYFTAIRIRVKTRDKASILILHAEVSSRKNGDHVGQDLSTVIRWVMQNLKNLENGPISTRKKGSGRLEKSEDLLKIMKRKITR
jgi:hypothetical protein